MAKIKWIGILDGEPSDYQKGDLDSRAKKMAMPATMQEMMIRALPFAVLPFLTVNGRFVDLFKNQHRTAARYQPPICPGGICRRLYRSVTP